MNTLILPTLSVLSDRVCVSTICICSGSRGSLGGEARIDTHDMWQSPDGSVPRVMQCDSQQIPGYVHLCSCHNSEQADVNCIHFRVSSGWHFISCMAPRDEVACYARVIVDAAFCGASGQGCKITSLLSLRTKSRVRLAESIASISRRATTIQRQP